MTDTFSRRKRSQIMSAVRSTRNKSTELKLIELLQKNHFTGWRRGCPLFGKPDFTFPKKKVVIFTDGCFWHGHNCRNTKPITNSVYWAKKILRNKSRDRLVTRKLRREGWLVFRFWECDIQNCKIPIKLKAILKRRDSESSSLLKDSNNRGGGKN